jgi:archaellum component FlaF (FlaF/FlaG flagellin family)
MSISSQFLWRFLDDVWDLLPSPDRELFEAYWEGQLQIAGNMEQKAIEVSLSSEVADVPVYLTERWNKFVMNDESCDLFAGSEMLELVGTVATALERDTVFFHTLRLSTSTSQIHYEEDIQFFDESERPLRYGKIVAGTIRVTIGSFEYTQNRDYAVNRESGTIQALDNGRLPVDDVATIMYQHEEYTLDLDYEVNESRNTVKRLAGSTIASGATVTASYTYNTTATLLLTGNDGAVDGTVLTDTSKDFSNLLPGRTLTITTGANAGTYSINSALSPTEIQIAESFPSVQTGDVVYTIDAFPHGQRVDKRIVSIPQLQDLVGQPNYVLEENIDYRVQGGILATRAVFRLSELGQEDEREPVVWAEKTSVNDETPYRNFGVLIDFYRTNSEAYKLALQGLWYAFWTGSTPGNLQRGIHILMGLPYAREAGTVTLFEEDTGTIEITSENGKIISYTVPNGLVSEVTQGDEVARFERLTNGVKVTDRNNTPGFVATHLGRAGIEKFLTSRATRGPGDTDETKALELLEHHLFLPQILAESFSSLINVLEFKTFLDNMKPKWTTYVFSFAVEVDEEIELPNDPVENGEWVNALPGELVLFDLAIDLSTTVGNNEWNQSFAWDSFLLDRNTGWIPAAGTQATGNFIDPFVNFVTLNVDEGDTVMIQSGQFAGYHTVLARISVIKLALDIPDIDIVEDTNIEYYVIPEERNLNHDAVHLMREHLIRPGTEYLTPATLNTKTDAVITDLEDIDLKAMLLVDAGNISNEVQVITNADVASSEFDVGAPPGVLVRNHEVASAAVKRRNNTTATVTHAFAI